MRWKKLGKVFDPSEHRLLGGTSGYAQSPQALVFDDFVRVYFSTREKDQTGKFLSNVAFADFDKAFTKVLNTSTRSVISRGGLGCFDEHGIFPFNVLRHGGKVLGYTTGWNRRVSVSTDAAIGHAVSEDEGLTFNKIGLGPVLSASLHQPCLVGDAYVRVFGGLFHMWYIFGARWMTEPDGVTPARVYKIAHATSKNGVDWVPEDQCIIRDVLDTDECQALPSVIERNGTYHMFFCYRNATGFRHDPKRAYRIGYAQSGDLTNWTRNDADLHVFRSSGEWDSDMQCYPHVFEMDADIYLLYNGNEFGRFGFGLAVLEN